ncbi:MAG: phosphoglucosamine mutase [Acidobacteria bacterium]|nr:MAG: phosphoglucosamine mutase [Acidobacteriota bacterium]REK02491.1 MAG: phosphoglucosamine mutase [Acidobacteriota bacterium]REK13707.1 MAG: phosphoglucosamine mutase [Acidobacteriota bacterium]REK41701.1 MAG: phosphoglucosamine mutase [Acidobacteriota bacterium]
MTKLFGTDGIRSRSGSFPLDEETLRIIGFALAERLRGSEGEETRFITGRDTRESGAAIESAIHSGIRAAGGSAVSAGVITTPGVAFLTSNGRFNAGIVISASHNPFEDNGLKIFLPDGRKLDRESEEFIEQKVDERVSIREGESEVDDSGASALQSKYLQHFSFDFGLLDLSGLKIIADCANGAASMLAPLLFRKFGGEIITINAEPDGRNINRNCGSLHVDHLRLAVLESGADIGVAFDGDADRALFIDEEGELLDGDGVLWIMANFLKDREVLKGNKVIATVMSNVGLELALKEVDVELVRTAVGDKYVLDEIVASDASLGGEQSGHIIFPSRTLVGDGLQTALFVLEAMTETGRSLSELRSGFVSFPQILVNVKVSEKVPFEEIQGLNDLVDETERELEGSGRLLLRYSGTENLARVMIEGREQSEIEELANRLADHIAAEIGSDDG